MTWPCWGGVGHMLMKHSLLRHMPTRRTNGWQRGAQFDCCPCLGLTSSQLFHELPAPCVSPSGRPLSFPPLCLLHAPSQQPIPQVQLQLSHFPLGSTAGVESTADVLLTDPWGCHLHLLCVLHGRFCPFLGRRLVWRLIPTTSEMPSLCGAPFWLR